MVTNSYQNMADACACLLPATKPDGTPRKLMDVGRLNAMGWKASTPMQSGLAVAYQDFIAANS